VKKSRGYTGSISQFIGGETQQFSLAVDDSDTHMASRDNVEQGMAITAQPGRRDLKQCPRCGTTMLLQYMIAKCGSLPETRRYRCPICRCVVEEEIDRDGYPFQFAGLATWPGARLVN